MQLQIQVNKYHLLSILFWEILNISSLILILILILILTIRYSKNVTQKQFMNNSQSVFGNISWDVPAEHVYLYDDGDPDEEED